LQIFLAEFLFPFLYFSLDDSIASQFASGGAFAVDPFELCDFVGNWLFGFFRHPIDKQDAIQMVDFVLNDSSKRIVLGAHRTRGHRIVLGVLGDTASYSGTQLFLGCPFTPIWVVSLRVRSALQLPAPFVDRSTHEFDVCTKKII
jgi:hypothetical protein